MQHIVIDPGGAMQSAGLAFIVPDNREAIGAALDALIARLDEADGDPDQEDATGLEDDFEQYAGRGPGCPIADPDCGIEDPDEYGSACGDRSYPEWHTLSAATRRVGRIDGKSVGSSLSSLDEDVEDDDPGGGNVDDGPHDPETDMGIDDQPHDGDHVDGTLYPAYGIDQTEPPNCPSQGQERLYMAPHRDRIRATRCERVPAYNGRYSAYYGDRTHRLLPPGPRIGSMRIVGLDR